jgi:large subunit ribosomal protein L21e
MAKGKKVREKGKIKLSRYYANIKEGQTVAIVPELGIKAPFPKRLKGKSGTVIGERGTHKLIKLKEGNKMKTFIIHPVHLKTL